MPRFVVTGAGHLEVGHLEATRSQAGRLETERPETKHREYGRPRTGMAGRPVVALSSAAAEWAARGE